MGQTEVLSYSWTQDVQLLSALTGLSLQWMEVNIGLCGVHLLAFPFAGPQHLLLLGLDVEKAFFAHVKTELNTILHTVDLLITVSSHSQVKHACYSTEGCGSNLQL